MEHADSASSVPGAVQDLLTRFARERAGYRGRDGHVERLWRALLMPFLAALGWDAPGPPETWARPVCLRAGGRRALFVQVVSPAKRLSRAPEAIFALRRYAWSAGLPLAMVTSFRELAIYDCNAMPASTDRAGAARILYATCDTYAARWHEIARLVSRAAVVQARAGQRAAGKRRAAVAVEAALVADLEAWRCALARALVRRMGCPDEHALSLAVQRALERLLFLRMCEERGLAPLDAQAPGDMTMDDDVLRAITASLDAPESPYVFSVMSPGILGHVHERSLDRRLRLVAGAEAEVVIEDRPGIRRAGGIYYTPRHIVDHVVQHTVGAQVLGKTPGQVRGIRILDPACGAGWFLLGAYQYLLHWHEQAYLRSDRPADRERLARGADGAWHLTTRERLRILSSNLYGVDIDARAAEMTRMSLLLEALDGAHHEPPRARLPLSDMLRPGSALHANIRCGNALVAPDFFARHGRDLDPEEAHGIGALDWTRAFPQVLDGARPGFDVVLGNPPWGQKGIMESAAVKHYVRGRFQSVQGHYDLFRPFIEQGIRLLRRGSGRFGMVLPDIVLLKDYQETRRYLLDNLSLTHIDWWGRAFPSAVIDAATIVGVQRRPPRAHAVHVTVRASGGHMAHPIPQSDFRANDRYVFNLTLTPERRAIVARLGRGPRLGDFFAAHEGVHSGNIRAELFVDRKLDASCEPLLLGRDEIVPYRLRWAGAFLRLAAAPRQRRGARYANVGRPAWFHAGKVLVRRTGDRVLAAVDREGRYASNNFFVVLAKRPCALGLDGLCALLNSRLMTWYFRAVEPRKGRAFAELKIKHLSAFPLPDMDRAAGACAALERLGAERARAQGGACEALDRDIDAAVEALFGITERDLRTIDSAR